MWVSFRCRRPGFNPRAVHVGIVLVCMVQKRKSCLFKASSRLDKNLINYETIEHVQNFSYLDCEVSYRYDQDCKQKPSPFQHMCGEIRIMLKYKTMEDANIKFYIVISAPVLVFGSENSSLNRSERREIETAEICFPTRVSGYALTDHVHSATVRN